MSDNNNAELFTALAQAQAAFKLVETDQKVDFPIQGGRRVIYDYASFAAIFKMAQKPLTDNGLSVHQVMLDGNLITTLAHSSGQSVSSISPLPTGGDIKQLGANLSYLRRYQYTAIVGAVVGGEDNEEAVEGDVEETSKQVDNGKSSKPKKTEKQSDPWPAKSGPVFEFCQNVERAYTIFHKPVPFSQCAARWFW